MRQHTVSLAPRLHPLLIALLLLTLLLLSLASAGSAQTFVPTGNMRAPRTDHAAALLSGGNTVLITGGSGGLAGSLKSAELYDVGSGTFQYTTNTMNAFRYAHTATLLANGQVLVAGGFDSHSETMLSSAELFDPAAQSFAVTGPMITPRQWHTATLLDNGKVLVTGGLNTIGGTTNVLSSAETYDPLAGTFTTAPGAMSSPRYGHTATLLGNGKVLIAGGCTGNGLTDCVNTADVLDPATGNFTPTTQPMLQARAFHTATLLSTGKVLIAGGVQGIVSYTAELYDPATDTFSATGPMIGSFGAVDHSATILLNGNVLIAGGDWGSGIGVTNQAELYDPLGGNFSLLASTMSSARFDHTATRLGNGQVLLAGGVNATSTVLQSADLFEAAESVTQPLSSAGGTASFIFANNAYNIVYRYPPGFVPSAGCTLTVTPIQTSQSVWNARTETSYSATQLAPVTGLGGDGIVFRAVALDSSGQPCPEPLPDVPFDITSSWQGPAGNNPGFLKAQINGTTWENVFVSYSSTRTDGGPDPTVVGRSRDGFSDWAAVFGVAQTTLATISINSPQDGATYEFNQTVNADYTCTRQVACIGDVPVGSPIDTFSAASKTFTVLATVATGTPARKTVNYIVSAYYVCLLYNPTRSVKSGATYPIKFYLCDANGNNLSSPSITVTATSLTQTGAGASSDLEDAGNSNPDSNFRFSSDLCPGGGYIFNLKTTGLHGQYQLNFTVSSDTPGAKHSVAFQVK